MKAENNIMPVAPFEIEYNGGMCEVRFFDNVREVTTEEGIRYEYDEFLLKIRNRQGIERDIENNLGSWLQMAKDIEYNKMITRIREDRNKLLEESDKYLLADYPITELERERIIKYRQQLRDITKQKMCPYWVEFPTLQLKQVDPGFSVTPEEVIE